jgi:1-acyl-sn-glycerol-3-phosphate acyltransferase
MGAPAVPDRAVGGGADDEGRAPVTQEAHTGAAHTGGGDDGRPPRRPGKWRTRRPVPPGIWLAIVVVYPVASLLFRLRYRHGERIPATGPVLLVANHVSVLDPLACGRLVFDNGRIPHFLAKESLFTGILGTLLRAAGQIPVARHTTHAKGSVSAAQYALAENRVVVIYPEGSVTRDPDWWPMQARTGVARLALTTDAVVVPVAQWGPQRLHDYHTKKWHVRLRTPTDYNVGEPVDLESLRAEVRDGRPLTGDLLRQTTDLIMARIRDLLGELREEQPPSAFYSRPVPELPGDVSGTSASGSAA